MHGLVESECQRRGQSFLDVELCACDVDVGVYQAGHYCLAGGIQYLGVWWDFDLSLPPYLADLFFLNQNDCIIHRRGAGANN